MPRETKDLVTSTGKKYTIKSYITFEEFEPTGEIESITKRSAKLVEMALVSLEDSTENVYARARQLSVADYTDISKEVTKILTGGFTPAK